MRRWWVLILAALSEGMTYSCCRYCDSLFDVVIFGRRDESAVLYLLLWSWKDWHIIVVAVAILGQFDGSWKDGHIIAVGVALTEHALFRRERDDTWY